MREEREQTDVERNNFLLKILHDMETPLNHIVGVTKMLDLKGQRDIRASYKREIEESVDMVKQIMNHILEVSMVQEGNHELSLTKVQLDELFDWIEAVFRPLAEKKGVRLEFLTTTACTNYLLLDKEKWMLIYYNLLMNAVEYTPEGGSISVKTQEVYQRENTIFVRSVIRDSGIGMSRDMEAAGPGIAIVKNLLHLMNGALHIQSADGMGTTSTITYTVQIPQEISSKIQGRERISSGVDMQGRTVLLIEDNDMNRFIAKNILDKTGAKVIEAVDGGQAVEKFRQCEDGEVSVILSDIMMPQVNGLQMTEQIRQMNRQDAKTIPIVAVTANTFDQDVARIFAYGMDAFLPKPISQRTVYGVIDAVLNG